MLLRSNHYPQTSIDVGGVDVAAPAGGLWGGDVFAYPVASLIPFRSTFAG